MRTNKSNLKKSPISKILKATLHRRWFDEIASGIKTEEYREVKPYWEKRLSQNYDFIEFRNGYKPDSPVMLVEYKGYIKKKILNPITNRIELVYALKLGRVHEINNYEVRVGDSKQDMQPY